jgi:A/G-specific adenine glycosylase
MMNKKVKDPNTDMLNDYGSILQNWALAHPRPMPWKGISDPYRIWLSEIILQQTRVEQGLPYYERFVAAYPTISDLAAAPLDDIYKLWEGLGYYSRARNMYAAAQSVLHEHHGVFPNQYKDIKALKGVGDYTAAAIASFAYNLPYAVLDGNVYRVLSRWFGLDTPIDSTKGKQVFSQLADELLDTAQPALHNQAMMDFGATWCTPKQPHCADCPFQSRCKAFQDDTMQNLPVKSKKMVKKERFFLYLVLKKDGQTFLKKRTAKDIWQNLWEFPCIEPDTLPTDLDTANEIIFDHFPNRKPLKTTQISKVFQQTLTHRWVSAVFVTADLGEIDEWVEGCSPAAWDGDLEGFAVPRIIEWYWKTP